MQYVRNLSDSVSTAWNSINPATLSGAIDVIVVEQDDGALLCSPFHVRFGKFSLLRPSEKKVEFKINGAKQDYSMKLGEGGEAFFVFETSDNIPQSLQTSPLASPVSSPSLSPTQSAAHLSDPEPLDLDGGEISRPIRPGPGVLHTSAAPTNHMFLTPSMRRSRAVSNGWGGVRPHSDDIIQKAYSPRPDADTFEGASERSLGPPPPACPKTALERATVISRELSAANIPTHITSSGDLMLDMAGFKSKEEDVFRAEILARRLLTDELDGNYDIGSLIGVDEQGNLWIYSSQDAKEAAMKRSIEGAMLPSASAMAADAASDPGYQSDGSDLTTRPIMPQHRRADSDLGTIELPSLRNDTRTAGDPNRNYAKTLRLTSDQLKALDLKPGVNSMSFTVNRATCQAYMYLWRHNVPVVISDIDGTITKSDALGHVLNMIGRDWTHSGIAKLYSDISTNGYNIMYLTSRSVGQADTTRAYLHGIVQDGYRLPRGPTILSPDRTMAALRREIYLRKPHVFKMATLRDIRGLYPLETPPFYAGFGNRLTDQISYRTVDVPRKRIFTINSVAEVSLDLLTLNKKLSYVNINEVVDHYFPPVSTLIQGGGEDYTDFKYWRDTPLDLDQFSASESEDGEDGEVEADEADEGDQDDDEIDDGQDSIYADDGDEVEYDDEAIGESYFEDDGELQESAIFSDEEEMTESMLREHEKLMRKDLVNAEEVLEEEGHNYPQDTTPIDNTPPPQSQDADVKAHGGAVVEDVGAELITGVVVDQDSPQRRKLHVTTTTNPIWVKD